MTKCMLGILFCLLAYSSYSAQVEWNTITAEYDSIGPGGVIRPSITFYAPHVDLCMDIDVISLDTGVELRAKTFSLYMEYATAFVVANVGDVVNDMYIDTNPMRFSYARYSDQYGEDLHADCSIILKDGETAFLAFRNEAVFGYPTWEWSTTFGWIELGLGDDGLVRAVRSAWDMDGDPLVVGAIPEPSSAVLLLVGFAMTILKQRKTERS